MDLDLTTRRNDIARGGFGTIYASRLRDGTPVAIKCLDVLTSQNQVDWRYSHNLKVSSD